MCSKCDEINRNIDRYLWLRKQANDHQMHEAADRLMMGLEADKLALHPKA